MNPFGVSGNIFATQANQAANGFINPISPAYTGGGWGIDPSMMTPSYDAPYRPRFNGPSPYAAYKKPGFFSGFNNTVNPFVSSPYWGNPIEHGDADATAMGARPFDFGMSTGQRFVAPAIAYGLSQKIMTGSYGLKGIFGGAAGGGWAGGVGRSAGMGLARGLGMSGMGATAAGGVGAFAAGIALPLATGYAVTSAIDAAVFQPYARMRQINEDLRSNFSGVTFRDAVGDSITGQGLNRREAGRISAGIEKGGRMDMTWSATQYGAIADMAGKSGLLDGANSKQIVDQVRGISEQIKLITAISKDPSIQGAIEELGKLRMGGASHVGGGASQAASVYRRLGMAAASAGTSIQNLMSGVGLQGQYLYQMNGLTPVLGQLSAANSYAGFAQARRNGILSDAEFARMGGESGGTQSVVSAKLAAMQTPYNMMIQTNRYMYGNQGNTDVSNTVARFGANAAANPLSTMGGMILGGGAMLSAQDRSGTDSMEEQAIRYLKQMGRNPGPNGWDVNEIAMAWKQMGFSDEQIRASYNQILATKNNGSTEAISGETKKQLASFISQNRLGDTVFAKANRGIHTWWNTQMQEISEMTSVPINSAANYMGDKMSELRKFMDLGNSLDTVTTFGDAMKQIGGDENSLGNLQAVREATELRSLMNDDMTEGEKLSVLSDKLNDPKYANLRKMIGDVNTPTAWKKIESLTNSAMRSGLIGTAAVYKPGMTVNELNKLTKGSLLGSSVNPGSAMKHSEFNTASKLLEDEVRTKVMNYQKQEIASQIDTSKTNGMIKSLDKLDSASENLNQAAEKIKGSSVAGGKPTEPNWFQKTFYGDEKKNPVGAKN